MDASGEISWDTEICRICEQALAGDELPDDLRARVSSRYAQALVYGGEYERAGEVSRGLGRTEDIEFLAARFEPFRGRHVANGAGTGVYMGPVELQLGLAAALGRLDAAVADLQTAVSICDANGACGYGVQAAVELAAVLVRRLAPGDRDRARAVLDHAAGEAERLGMAPFTRRIEQLRAH